MSAGAGPAAFKSSILCNLRNYFSFAVNSRILKVWVVNSFKAQATSG